MDYLKPGVQVDPLFDDWYAWAHLIPPATAAMNVVDRHLRIMRSYVSSPAMHAAAVRSPALRGGPFLDLDGKHVEVIRAMAARTEATLQAPVELAGAIKQLRALVAGEATGMALESLYAKIPGPLRGLVELCYDGNGHASFRILESLLYRTPYYAETAQSVALSLTDTGRTRPFMLSTPRLPDPATATVATPFRSPGWDALFRARSKGGDRRAMAEVLGVDGSVSDLFASFFTEDAPPPPPSWEGDGVRIRYFGHATLLIETPSVRILTDPIVSYTYPSDLKRFTYQDLPEELDTILITHGHHDHILLETLLQLRHKARTIVVPRNHDGTLHDPSLKLMLENAGFDNVREVRDLEEFAIPGGRIVSLPFLGEHHDLLMASRSGYRIEVDGRAILLMADSCNLEPELFARLRSLFGPADALFVGMECEGAPLSWIYGPLLGKAPSREADVSRRARGSNCREAMDVAVRFGVGAVYVYAMGQEPWLSHILDNALDDQSLALREARALVEACRERGVESGILYGSGEIVLG